MVRFGRRVMLGFNGAFKGLLGESRECVIIHLIPNSTALGTMLCYVICSRCPKMMQIAFILMPKGTFRI